VEAANVSQLAERTGILAGTLTSRLRGRSSFKADELIAIALHLGVDPASFFADFAATGAKS